MDVSVLKEDLKDIRYWIFDLDDTLYPPSEEIYSQMMQRISAYIMRELNVDEKMAGVIGKGCYSKYGATVHGLVIEHHIVPEDFTNYIHEIDLSSLKENPELKNSLMDLSGKRFIFTNGAYHHAERVMERIGISDCFDGIFSIREADYLPKPAEKTYEKMLKTFGIEPSQAIMFDDSPVNILAAHKAGMKTVWISSNVLNNQRCSVDVPDFYDYQTSDVTAFLSSYLTHKSA